MIEDFRALPDGLEIDCDICIVGTGAAGITLAKSLAGTGLAICLIEGGDLELDFDSQDLYEGEIVGEDYSPLTAVRYRLFGGTTNIWTGNCIAYEPVDFAERSWIPHSGWPIAYDEYAAFLPRARALLELAEPYDPNAYWEAFGIKMPAFDPEKLHFTTLQRTEPIRFGEHFRTELEATSNIRVLLNANLVDINVTPGADHVESLGIKSLDGRNGTIRARRVVLACGGIENARLLLANRQVEPHGLGNRHDLVGRFFSDHVHVPIGEVLVDDRAALLDPLGDQHYSDGRTDALWRPYWMLTPELQERYELSNNSVYLFAEGEMDGVRAAAEFANALEERHWPANARYLSNYMLRDAGDVAAAVWNRFVLGQRTVKEFSHIGLEVMLDPAPHSGSRVRLTDELDALGMPRIELDLHSSPIESRGIPIIGEIAGAELARLGLGRLKLYDWVGKIGDGSWYDAYMGTETADRFMHRRIYAYHNMGTTRMAVDPRNGVVDTDCKVHGIDNLYIAGSSIFPTAGNTNPTLSIVAMAFRLAEHLEKQPA